MSDVPEGYKMSKVGVIPEEWEVDRIKNIASITTGAKNTQDKIDDGEYPFYVRSSIIERINSYSFDGEAVLTAGDGVGTGKVIHYINGKFDFHQRVYKISDFSEKIEGYFFYLFFSNYFLKRIMAMTAKSSVDSVRMEMIAEMPIPLPPLPEQQAIASALSDVDALITALEQLITKKRNIKQGAMQQLITGKKRLPGFGGVWEVKKLGEIAEMYSGGTPSTSVAAYYNGNIPWVVIADMTKSGKYIYETEKNISHDGIKNSSAKLFNKGTLLFAMYASIGKCSIAKIDLTCNQAILGIKPQKIDTEFLYYYLFINEEKFGTIGQTGTQKNLNKEMVQAISIPYPLIKEQTAIAQILSDMDTEIESLEQKRDKYKAIKQGMMQELLTGERRLA
jgi:type I restriction enzyme S subunit